MIVPLINAARQKCARCLYIEKAFVMLHQCIYALLHLDINFLHKHQPKSSLAVLYLMCNLKRLDEKFRLECREILLGGIAVDLLDAITAASAAAVVIAALIYRL
ncbi:hypothetical protein ACIQW9_09965 [Herminiimonas sp. NPDC097707]|uniref:hypothetical protein n=1 Tax=Herminiimonas sp. NPDC097707 TaxID=3364007 RepID=UPI00383A524F